MTAQLIQIKSFVVSIGKVNIFMRNSAVNPSKTSQLR